MKNLILLPLSLLFYPFCLFSQNIVFQETFTINNASTSGEVIAATNDNGYAIAGETNVNGNAESFLAKFNSTGMVEWTKVYYDNQSHILINGVNDTEIICNQYLKFLLQTSDNGFVLGGGIDSAVFITYPNGVQTGADYFRMFLIKTDAGGNLLWSKKYALNDFNGAAAIAENIETGGYYVAGYAHQTGSVVTDDLFIRLDNDGNIIWSKSFGGTNSEGISDMKKTSDGNYILCGTSESFSNNQNIYVVKMDTSGNELWSNVYGTTGFDYGKSVLQSSDGGYFIYGNAGTGNPSYVAIIRTDDSGNLLWSNTYGNGILDGPSKLLFAIDGSLLALVDHYTGQYDGLIIHVDTSGSTIANRAFGTQSGDNNDFITSLLPFQNSFLLTGYSNSFSSSQFIYNGYFIKTNEMLFSGCYEDSLNSNATPVSIVVSPAATAVADVVMNYYQMQVTEMDSDFIADTLCSSVFTIVPTIDTLSSSISLFPDPAADQIFLHGEQPFSSVHIVNFWGEEMRGMKFNPTRDLAVDISDFPAGIYLINIYIRGNVITQRFSVVH